MDEPTAVLTPMEVEDLFNTLRTMARSGHPIIFISHKWDEVLKIADRITVLRRGRVEASNIQAGDISKNELARIMVGREVLFRIEKKPCQPGEVALEVQDLEALDDKGLPALRRISLTVRSGEILGLAGVAGNGQRELAEVICGLRPALSGHVRVHGKEITNTSPAQILEEGVSFIPEDRVGMGSVPNLTIAENLALRSYRYPPIGNRWRINRPLMDRRAEELIKRFDIMTPSVNLPSRLLSGGNLQRMILARETSADPRVIIAMHPTRGLDVGATEATHRVLLMARDQGSGILLISEDLDEILALADRIAVLYEGQIMGIVEADQADIEHIGLMMAGSHPESEKP